ncbi:TonB family protein [Mucilaginibacter yixingensis]|uniref:TonB family protein n=1 Tax=Mucilaginibacter yixingensis TaxID=1295612 RepID=A0A2T5JDR8_9SPHI|nr:energy transducer TonB [Mucilaginibacter yixingensis]PTQ99908.1 TonB family protein [Mucilaginibacter yixingensis]
MKHFFTCFFLLTAACFAKAQGQSTVYYLNKKGQITTSKDSALIVRTVTSQDAATGLYAFNDATTSGKQICSGQTTKINQLYLQGHFTAYYPSGSKLADAVFNNDQRQVITIYYPNGQQYLTEKTTYESPSSGKYGRITDVQILTCADSTGKMLTANGNGSFIDYQPQIAAPEWSSAAFRYGAFHEGYASGELKNGEKDGKWEGGNRLFAYEDLYQGGKFVKGKSFNNGKTYEYTELEKSAEFNGGITAFYQCLSQNVVYPQSARRSKISGEVFVTFVINFDGHLTEAKVLRSPHPDLSAAALQALAQCPAWTPGTQRGRPVRQQFTVPLTFTLPGN